MPRQEGGDHLWNIPETTPALKPKGKPLSHYYSSRAPSIFIQATDIYMSQAHSGHPRNQKAVHKGLGFPWGFQNSSYISVTLRQQEPGLATGKQDCPLFQTTLFRLQTPGVSAPALNILCSLPAYAASHSSSLHPDSLPIKIMAVALPASRGCCKNQVCVKAVQQQIRPCMQIGSP